MGSENMARQVGGEPRPASVVTSLSSRNTRPAHRGITPNGWKVRWQEKNVTRNLACQRVAAVLRLNLRASVTIKACCRYQCGNATPVRS